MQVLGLWRDDAIIPPLAVIVTVATRKQHYIKLGFVFLWPE